jgi:acetyl-CoA carboxylase beta subunit
MSWFRREKPKIEELVSEEERKVKTEGIFVKCPECDNPLYRRELKVFAGLHALRLSFSAAGARAARQLF